MSNRHQEAIDFLKKNGFDDVLTPFMQDHIFHHPIHEAGEDLEAGEAVAIRFEDSKVYKRRELDWGGAWDNYKKGDAVRTSVTEGY